MARIEVQALVLAFEKRIEALEKNPPELISTAVVLNMLEKSIDEIIKEHFLYLIKKDLAKKIKKEFNNAKDQFARKAIDNILNDSAFRTELEKALVKKIIQGI